jgi:hypothetical protein
MRLSRRRCGCIAPQGTVHPDQREVDYLHSSGLPPSSTCDIYGSTSLVRPSEVAECHPCHPSSGTLLPNYPCAARGPDRASWQLDGAAPRGASRLLRSRVRQVAPRPRHALAHRSRHGSPHRRKRRARRPAVPEQLARPRAGRWNLPPLEAPRLRCREAQAQESDE